ncbi:serine/threonine-protein kinase [Dactylosporangium aurantiacum]|nr:serine/threonine-protein kinase [Dactylosporangium aurantiacum]MDG6108707.1 protein kinase [Dactylosporangium aurantiacum]
MPMIGGRYRLIAEAGTGGMASVWRAVDVRLERTVAVKMLQPHLAGAQARAEVEARAAARLVHPNIAVVHDAGRLRRGLRRRLPYLVMEFVDGETLGQRLAGSESMPWQQAVRIAVQVADALNAAHLHRVVHRDIKPGNIILTASRVKVVDFGLAAFCGVLPAGPVGVMLGTPEYMAPEQVRGEPVSAAADVYALGLVLMQMLTGALPWTAADRPGLVQQRCGSPQVRMPPMAQVPAAVVALCDQCLSNDPERRPSSREVARVLREVLVEHGTYPEPDTHEVSGRYRPAPVATPRPVRWESPARHRRHRRSVVTLVAVLAAVLGWIHPIGRPSTATASGTAGAVAAAGPGQAPPAACAVRYTSHRDGTTFAAELSVAGRVRQPWTLQFTVPAGQHVAAVTGMPWSQTDTRVTLTGTEPLSAGRQLTATMSGALDRVDAPPPTGFAVNGISCERVVSVLATSRKDSA